MAGGVDFLVSPPSEERMEEARRRRMLYFSETLANEAVKNESTTKMVMKVARCVFHCPTWNRSLSSFSSTFAAEPDSSAAPFARSGGLMATTLGNERGERVSP